MRYLPVALIGALLVTAPASATVRYLSPTGTSTADGLTASTAWNLAKVNSSLVAGDVCRVLPGSYTGDIAPVNSGQPTARITIVGDLANPAAATFTGGIATDRSYLSIKGVKVTGGISLKCNSSALTAQYDSVAWCMATSVSFEGSKHNLVARCRILNGTAAKSNTVAFVMNGWYDWPTTGQFMSNAEYDTLRGNTIEMGTISWKGFAMRTFAQRCVIDSNFISGRFTGTNPDVQGRYLYNSYYNTFRDNRWVFEADNALPGNVPWNCFSLRDSSSYNLFERDTIYAGLQSNVPMYGRLMNAGVTAWNGQTVRNTFRQCVWKMTGYLYVQMYARGTVMDRCLVASTGSPAISFPDDIETFTVDHCTFYSGTGHAAEFPPIAPTANPDSVRFTSNILMSPNVPAGDATIKMPGLTGFTSNGNVFYTPTSASRAVYWNGVANTVAAWCSASSRDCQSRFGDPKFLDANFATLDVRLGTGSSAIGAGLGGSDAGAFPFSTPGPDATPPAVVSNLLVTSVADSNLILGWTATGDDGNSGVATAYDLRWSTAPIDVNNFASATPVTVAPTPQPGGTPQTYVVLGLRPSTTYWFALRARDEAGNWSGLSNVATATTATVDQQAPATIFDLSATP